jgi:LacI family transcriptional regulator, galactose operon repressor
MNRTRSNSNGEPRVTLKTIAQRLGLTPGTVSAALNNSAAARSIPEPTKQKILATAREMGYSPNYFARSLRLQRAYTIGVIAEEIGDPYGGMVVSGVEEYLRKHNYFFLAVSHRHDREVLRNYSKMLMTRGVEGFITTDTSITEEPALPTVAVSGHERVNGVTNIILDHKLAVRLAIAHLMELGHERIAFLIGDPASSDSATRWAAIKEVGAELGLPILPELTVQIDSRASTPDLGYPFAKQLLERNVPFTALFAYNDLSAIGAIWAFREAGLRIPEDISVVGFDDIPVAAFTHPGLTTVRQPLKQMGQIAAKTVIDQIEGKAKYVPEIVVEPELVVRCSTAPASLSSMASYVHAAKKGRVS